MLVEKFSFLIHRFLSSNHDPVFSGKKQLAQLFLFSYFNDRAFLTSMILFYLFRAKLYSKEIFGTAQRIREKSFNLEKAHFSLYDGLQRCYPS